MTSLKNSKKGKPTFKKGEKKVDYWKITALIGTVLFLLSAFLPMISDSLFNPTSSASLLNFYTVIGQSGQTSAGSVTIDIATIGILLTMMLYPITIILGLISIFKRRVAMAAGIVGLICWIGTLIALGQLNFTQYAGMGVYVGITGAIIMAAAYFMKPSSTAPQVAFPPPPQNPPSR